MISPILLVLLFSSLTHATSNDVDIDTILTQYQQSMEILWQQNREARDDDCFVWYINEQNVNMQTYRKSTAQCGQTADARKKQLAEDGAGTRAGLIGRGDGICKELADCEAVADLLDFYKCYYNTTNDNTGELYKLSTESNAEYNALSVKYKNIDADCDVCIAKARDQYIKDSADTDKQFQICEAGGGLPTNKPTDKPTDEPTTIEIPTKIPPA